MQNLGIGSVALALVVPAVVAATPAYADGGVAGTYEVKFEEVSTNCDQHSITYPARGQVKIEVKAGDLKVDIERTPLMVGKEKGLKLSAKSPKPGHTVVQGMDGTFSVAGRVTDEGMLSLVMVGEYQAGGKPLCTQSWNLSGLRGGTATPEKPADKPKAPPAKK